MARRLTTERKDAIIAASVTFGVAIVVLLLLFFLSLDYDRQALAQMSTPEMIDDEEVFLEPELLVVGNDGETDLDETTDAAPQTPGEPDPAEKEQPLRVVKNEVPPKETPVSNKPKQVAANTESDVKTSTPKLSKEEEQRIASMGGKLKSDNNGSRTGAEGANSGTGGTGVSTDGALKGRSMISCPTWKLKLNQRTVVTVNVTVDADGNVTQASARSGAGSNNLRAQCVKMAKGSKWTPKKGAAPASGTITFTIIPQ